MTAPPENHDEGPAGAGVGQSHDMITASRWQRARELFHACLDLPEEERGMLLKRECAEDPLLLAEVQSLLASAAASGTFLETPAGAAVALPAEPSWIGRQLGAYRITALLATGGMGEVYRAVRSDGLYSNDVAIKLIRRELAGQAMLARFRAEREILAALQHPHIARILDAGVIESGLPYIVMELIQGEAIDRYCEHHALSVRERLKLFLDVCGAVHYAHQHLTVHRDLKPGNILVTHEGSVKLVDFGIAKVLETGPAGDVPTAIHAMTPEYSSPEQIRGEPITTATDIYSLGVVLYRLLTGRSPYRTSSHDPYGLAREVCETLPIKPSANVSESALPAGGTLDSEIDSIVLMALRKERDRRYESAQQFANDVLCYLEHRPISARPRSWRYSLGCFIARNRAASTATALLVVALLSGVVAVAWEARIARAGRDRAQRHFDSVRQVANEFMFDVHDEIAKIPGSVKARQLLVNKALTYLDLLAKEAGSDTSLQLELAEAYIRVGSVQGRVGYNNLGNHEAALDSYLRGIALLEQALAPEPAARPEWVQLARAYNLANGNLTVLGRPEEEGKFITKELELTERRLARDSNSVQVLARLGHAYYRRSQFRASQHDPAGALKDAQSAVDMYEQVIAKKPDFGHKNNQAFAYSNLAEAQLRSKDAAVRAQGIESLRTALSIMRALVSQPESDVDIQRHFAVSANELGMALTTAGRPKEGMPYVNEVAPLFQKLFEADPNNRLARLDYAESETNQCTLWLSLSDPVAAIEHCRKGVEALGHLPDQPQQDLELSAAFVEEETNLACAYAAAAEAPKLDSKRRSEYWREADLSAAASLRVSNLVVAARPEVAADYTDFISRAQSVQGKSAHR